MNLQEKVRLYDITFYGGNFGKHDYLSARGQTMSIPWVSLTVRSEAERMSLLRESYELFVSILEHPQKAREFYLRKKKMRLYLKYPSAIRH